MKHTGKVIIGAATLAGASLVLSGCYTQMGMTREYGESSSGSQETQQGYDQQSDSVYAEDYESSRDRFYDESYYPYYSVGIGYGWYSPWYRYRNPWYWDPWYYDPFYYSPYAYSWGAYYGGYYPGYYYRPQGSYAYRNYGTPRKIGMNRTSGGSRTSGTYSTSPGVTRAGTSATTAFPSIPRPGYSTGRRGSSGERSAPARVQSSTTRTMGRAPQSTQRVAPSGSSSTSRGGRSVGTSRGGSRSSAPASAPARSAPSGGVRSSAPASHPAPSAPSGGGGRSSGGSGGSRGGGGRSR